jgi:TrmH family RNA methyltransferase
MLSKNKIKLIQSLNRKKDRDETGLFLVEGNKMVEEAIASGFRIALIACTPDFFAQYPELKHRTEEWIETDSETIRKASLLQNPQDALAIVYQEQHAEPEADLQHELCLALDFIQDPGNLGTILRIADWFGIRSVICSANTVDVYNPKVVQASMGAIFRVKTSYTDMHEFLKSSIENQVPVYGTFLEGKNIYTEPLSRNGILVMGNEGNGISPEIAQLVSHKISIPSFSSGKGSESLNVAVAAAICCSEFRRR